MNKFSIGARIAASFVLVLILLLVIGFLSISQMARINEDSDMVIQTQEVLKTISVELSNLQDAETGQRGFIITGNEDYLEPYNIALIAIPEQLMQLKKITGDNINQQLRIDRLEKLISRKLNILKESIELRRSKGFEAAFNAMDKIGKNLMDEIRVVLKEMNLEESKLLGQWRAQNVLVAKNAKNIIISVTVLAFLIVIFLIIILTRMIAFPIQEIAKIADRISSGDLAYVININRKDEIGMLADSFKRMQENLINQIREITESVSVLASSSSEIMASIAQLASSSSETATSIGETTTTVEEVKQTAIVSNHKAKSVSENAYKMADISKEGNKAIANTIEGMNKIRQQMNAIAVMVVRLSEQSQTIGEITATVNELAEQSNLLAVNAAIEAAKAGEQGKGFTVVAQEIKILATRSKEAAGQVRNILREITKSIGSAVMATEEGGKAVDEGLKLTTLSGETIRTLSESVAEAANAAFQITASSQQQLEGMDQVVVAMENIREASAQAVASTQQTFDSVNDLQRVGQKLDELMKQYKLN